MRSRCAWCAWKASITQCWPERCGQTLERELVSSYGGSEGHDSTSVLAELLDSSDRALVARVLATLEEAEPEAAARIRKMMFTFDDLVRVDPATLGVLISECAVEKLAVALFRGHTGDPRVVPVGHVGTCREHVARRDRDDAHATKEGGGGSAGGDHALAERLAEEGRIFLL